MTSVVDAASGGAAPIGERSIVERFGTPPRPGSKVPTRLLTSSWFPAVIVGVVAVTVLLWYGVSPRDVVTFAAYVLLGLTIPGALLWRAAHGRAGLLMEDLAAGTMVGYALEVLCYIPARAAGAPYLVLTWPLATIVTFAVVPRLRRFWRGAGRASSAPVWCSWPMAAVVLFLLAWSVATFFRTHGPAWPQNASPYFDMPYHLALAGELKHHAPPMIPWVTDEPAAYHWFVYADMAATSWVTGIELETLLYRLVLLPMLVCLTLVVGSAAVRLTGRWWTAPAAAAVTYFSWGPNPFGYSAVTFWDAQSLFASWMSPTHIFGLALFATAILSAMGLLNDDGAGETRRSGRVLRWSLFTVLVAATMGAKATFLPLLLGGLLLVLVGDLIARRRPGGPTLLATGITGFSLIFAQLVLFGGTDAGGRIDVFYTAKLFPIVRQTHLGATSTTVVLLAITMLAMVAWALVWAGAAGLFTVRARPADRRILLLAGVGAAAIAATMSLNFPGYAQAYFLRGAGPFLALLAVAGLAAVTPSGRRPWFTLAAAAAALATGYLVVEAVRQLGSSEAPTLASHGHARWVLAELALPYLTLIGVVMLIGLVLFAARRHWAALRGISLLLTLLVAMGFGLPQAWRTVGVRMIRGISSTFGPTPLADGSPEITNDNILAARWLRDHSRPDDLVATNAHCRLIRVTRCDNRHFWISAYAERRVLVEGWGYAPTSRDLAVQKKVAFPYLAYWNPDLLAANDKVFSAPSREAVQLLRDNYGVRWLFVESRFKPVPPELSRFARLRFQSGSSAVFEIG